MSVGASNQKEYVRYYGEEFRSIEPEKYSCTEFELRLDEVRSPYLTEPKDYEIFSSKALIFDEDGKISDEPTVYEFDNEYQVEIDVTTSFGQRTLVRRLFSTEEEADGFADDIITDEDDAELSITDEGSPKLRLATEVETSNLGSNRYFCTWHPHVVCCCTVWIAPILPNIVTQPNIVLQVFPRLA